MAKQTKVIQLNNEAQELLRDVPASRGIKRVMVLRGYYRPDVHADAIYGYYINVAYTGEAADYGLGGTAKAAAQGLRDWAELEKAWAE